MELTPDQRLPIDTSAAQLIAVEEGVLYVVTGENEAVLTAGDSMTIAVGETVRAWNAGDEPARVTVHIERMLRLAA